MRKLAISEDIAQELVVSMLKDDMNNMLIEMDDPMQHIEDRQYCKKMIKNMKKVLKHYVIEPK